MSGNVFKGPMLVIVLGAVAVLGVRYLPVDDILERIRAAGATDPAGSAAVVPPEPSTDVRLSTPVNRPPDPPAAPPPSPVIAGSSPPRSSHAFWLLEQVDTAPVTWKGTVLRCAADKLAWGLLSAVGIVKGLGVPSHQTTARNSGAGPVVTAPTAQPVPM